MIQDVQELGLKFQPRAFRKVKPLPCGYVEVVDPSSLKGVPARCGQSAFSSRDVLSIRIIRQIGNNVCGRRRTRRACWEAAIAERRHAGPGSRNALGIKDTPIACRISVQVGFNPALPDCWFAGLESTT